MVYDIGYESETNNIEVKLKFTPKGASNNYKSLHSCTVMYFESRSLTSYPHLCKVSIAQFSWGSGGAVSPQWVWQSPGGVQL